ncbi:MAG: CarD family transcriptional regulator [Pseudobacteriovorax sp.]|nr:CarD family transcriptional regulator [Pseudobacteriovorax sp.]
MSLVLESGNKVVHKTHGVGEIQGTEVLQLGGQSQDYYILKILATGLKVRFPMQASSAIVRSLVDELQIAEILEIIASPAKSYSMVWNRRKKEFNEKINSGSIFDIAEVYRDLHNKDDGKELSFGEKEMLEKAKLRLVSEIAAARSVPEQEVEQMIGS